jgi:hypothetical protein
MILQTESGTKYHMRAEASGWVVMRQPSTVQQQTDLDGRWIPFILGSRMVIGQPLELILAPQKAGVKVTLLNTTKITGVIW